MKEKGVKGGGGKGRESQANSPVSTEPHVGLDFITLEIMT